MQTYANFIQRMHTLVGSGPAVFKAICVLLALTSAATATIAREPKIVVYGATPAGIAAALAAGEDGQSVLLVEPTPRIGGLVTSGLSHTDIRTFESMTGAFLEFTQRVEAYYQATYGKDSPQLRACERGIFAEPSVNLLIFERMLAEQPRVELLRECRLQGVSKTSARTIDSVTLRDAEGKQQIVSARVFIDASYEGDLMAAAGCTWRAGREARVEYEEPLAPPIADDQLQAYNFRFVMTRLPENRVMPEAPPGYRREDFLPVLDVLKTGQIERVFAYPSKCLFKAQEPPLPNGKYDINDVSGASCGCRCRGSTGTGRTAMPRPANGFSPSIFAIKWACCTFFRTMTRFR